MFVAGPGSSTIPVATKVVLFIGTLFYVLRGWKSFNTEDTEGFLPNHHPASNHGGHREGAPDFLCGLCVLKTSTPRLLVVSVHSVLKLLNRSWRGQFVA